jgi:hypothetical protein
MLKVINDDAIHLASGLQITSSLLQSAVSSTNEQLRDLQRRTSALTIDAFSVIDFRMLSGLVGEMLVARMSIMCPFLEKNPNIDGYPDLVDVSTKDFSRDFHKWKKSTLGAFVRYPHGGIEVKNTFGTKKSGSELLPGQARIQRITSKPDWKAHHGYTNNLLALFSDYVDRCPQIVAAMYADNLSTDDWTKKQNPKAGSTMTSFTVIKRSGWNKLRAGLRLCLDDSRYLAFFGRHEH